MESAWAYRHRPAVNGRLLKRQRALSRRAEAWHNAWRAKQRLYKRYTALMARGKHKNQVVTALARELLGFPVGDRGPYRSAIQNSEGSLTFVNSCRTAAPIPAEGPRKGEPSSRIVRYGLKAQPALSEVRGGSRRIMFLRFRPAYISVINRRASSSAVIGSAVQHDPLLFRLRSASQGSAPAPAARKLSS